MDVAHTPIDFQAVHDPKKTRFCGAKGERILNVQRLTHQTLRSLTREDMEHFTYKADCSR